MSDEERKQALSRIGVILASEAITADDVRECERVAERHDLPFAIAQKRERGTVKWFNDAKGYGFIRRDSGGEVFVHYTNIQPRIANWRTLKEGERVEFDLVRAPKGLQAISVSLVGRYSEGYCLVTGNPLGTDTWPLDSPCQCENCRRFVDSLVAVLEGESEAIAAAEPNTGWQSSEGNCEEEWLSSDTDCQF